MTQRITTVACLLFFLFLSVDGFAQSNLDSKAANSQSKIEIPQPVPDDLPKAVEEKVRAAGEALLTHSCETLIQQYNPKQPKAMQLGLCFRTHVEERGIFAAAACVVSVIESETGTERPFYGSKGHWGIEGKCDPELVRKKIQEKETSTTVNPISAAKIKRQEGIRMRLLKDNLKIWETFQKATKP